MDIKPIKHALAWIYYILNDFGQIKYGLLVARDVSRDILTFIEKHIICYLALEEWLNTTKYILLYFYILYLLKTIIVPVLN